MSCLNSHPTLRRNRAAATLQCNGTGGGGTCNSSLIASLHKYLQASSIRALNQLGRHVDDVCTEYDWIEDQQVTYESKDRVR